MPEVSMVVRPVLILGCFMEVFCEVEIQEYVYLLGIKYILMISYPSRTQWTHVQV